MLKKFFILIFIIALLSGCSFIQTKEYNNPDTPSCQHKISERYGVSRDYTYINFSNCDIPYKAEGRVGGEHVSVLKILAFEGEKYSINLRSKEGNVECYVNKSQNLNISESSADKRKTIFVSVGAVEEILFEINIYAHPDGEYEITIKKEQ